MSCQTLRQQFTQIDEFMKSNPGLIQMYLQNPTAQNEQNLQEFVSKASEMRRKFLQEYEEDALDLLHNQLVKLHLPREEMRSHFYFEEDGRVVVKKSLESISVYYDLPSIIRKIEGDVWVNGEEAKSVDYLEEVGTMFIGTSFKLESWEDEKEKTPPPPVFKSLKRLRKVSGGLHIKTSVIEALESLEEVGQSFYTGTQNNSLENAPNLRKVGFMIIQDPTRNFRGVFPALKRVEDTLIDTGHVSFLVPDDNIKKQIEEEKQKGTISFDGQVLVKTEIS